MKDGVDGVVVDKPARLVEEAKKGASALAVQDRYPSGEAATSLLRQIRVARAEAVPAVVLLTGEIPQGDKLVLEKQYKVREFIRIAENPIRIAEAAAAAAGHDDDVILHPDEEKNAFDISVDSIASRLDDVGADSDEDSQEDSDLDRVASSAPDSDEDSQPGFDASDLALKTVEVSAADLRRLRAHQAARGNGRIAAAPTTISEEQMSRGGVDLLDPPMAPAARSEPTTGSQRLADLRAAGRDGGRGGGPDGADAHPLTQEAEELVLDNPTSEGLLDLSQLPPPGGEADVQFFQGQTTSVQNRPTEAAPPPEPELAPPAASSVEERSDPGPSPRSGDEGDPVQAQQQDMQKAQNELKKALLNERKLREAAQKRVEELEAKLAKVGDAAPKHTTGVPNEGVFEDLRYPALLARCRADAFTGAIVMQSGGATRNVYLKDGLPVAFHSSEPGERIGKVLVTQGRISDEQYMKATTRSVERSIKLTDALVELGWMDAETIAVEQRNLARDQIIQSFELVQGRFIVQAGATPDANTATFDFGPGEIYVQGYRRYAPASEMLAAYETLRDKYLIANARLASYRPKLGLNGDDERLLRLLGEALTVEEAVERASIKPEAAARLLSALQALELVEEWSPGVEQFRSRIRIEKQRQAEEVSQLLAEARQRETRLLEAFEKALARTGGGRLDVSLDEPAKPAAPTRTATPGVSMSSTSLGASSSAGSSASGAASALGSSSGRGTATLGSTAPAGGGGGAASAGANGSSFVHGGSAGSAVTAGPSAAAEPAASVGSSTGKSARDGGASLSIADLKYREGVEQAAQNRLDEAEVTLREAVRLDASKPEYLTSLARVLLANPRYERAGTLPVVRSLLDRAVQIAPDFQDANDLHAQVIKEMTG